MRTQEILVWQKMGAALKSLKAGLAVPAPSHADRLRRLLELLPRPAAHEGTRGAVSDLPGDVSSPKAEIPQMAGGSAAQVTSSDKLAEQLPAPGKIVSFFAVDPAKVTAGSFFRSLSFQRNDPGREMPVVFEQEAPRPVVETCRHFFAYAIPWTQRGGPLVGPTDEAPVAVPGGFQSLGQMAAAATAQAVHLASKMKREKSLVSAYAVGAASGASRQASHFFSSLPWTGRRPHSTPDNVIGLQA